MKYKYYSTAVLHFAGKALLNSLERHKLLLETADAIKLYRTVTRFSPLAGSYMYMLENHEYRMDDVPDFISEMNEIGRLHSSLVVDGILNMSGEWPLSLLNSINGFLEKSIDEIKELVDISSENNCDSFGQYFDFYQTDNNCLQLLYAMNCVDSVIGVFDELINIIKGDDHNEDCDEEDHLKAISEAISIMLEITPESVSEMLDEDLVDVFNIYPKDFTLYDGFGCILDKHRLVMS